MIFSVFLFTRIVLFENFVVSECITSGIGSVLGSTIAFIPLICAASFAISVAFNEPSKLRSARIYECFSSGFIPRKCDESSAMSVTFILSSPFTSPRGCSPSSSSSVVSASDVSASDKIELFPTKDDLLSDSVISFADTGSKPCPTVMNKAREAARIFLLVIDILLIR